MRFMQLSFNQKWCCGCSGVQLQVQASQHQEDVAQPVKCAAGQRTNHVLHAKGSAFTMHSACMNILQIVQATPRCRRPSS